MLSKIELIKLSIKKVKESKFGDLALLKSELAGVKIKDELEEEMQQVKGYFPKIDLNELKKLPVGTFGYEYAKHMEDNNLKPFDISEDMYEIAKNNVFSLRYAVTHDIYHLLLGFDTTYAGEIGVLAFATAQNYVEIQKMNLLIAKILYPILSPSQVGKIYKNVDKGYSLGKKVKCLLSYKFEENWHKPLEELRKELGFELLDKGVESQPL